MVTANAHPHRPSRRAALGSVAAWLCAAWGLLRSHPVQAEGAGFCLIVNQENPVSAAGTHEIADWFLKRATRWSDGELVYAVDLRPDASARRAFSERVLKRSVSAVRNYWQQRIFSGRDVPPPELDSDEAVIRYVASHRGAIGYISQCVQGSGIKVLRVT